MEGSVYKYTPNYDFINGEDQFIVSAVLDDGATINSKPFTIYMKNDAKEFPCGPNAVEDEIRMNPPGTAVSHPFNFFFVAIERASLFIKPEGFSFQKAPISVCSGVLSEQVVHPNFFTSL